jgi:hypothetical protein
MPSLAVLAFPMLGCLGMRGRGIIVLLDNLKSVCGSENRLDQRNYKALNTAGESGLKCKSNRAEEEGAGNKTIKYRLSEGSDAPSEAQGTPLRLFLRLDKVFIDAVSHVRLAHAALYRRAAHFVIGRHVPSAHDAKSQTEVDSCSAIWTITWHLITRFASHRECIL